MPDDTADEPIPHPIYHPPFAYVIWSFEHHAWWGPGQAGYTWTLARAGRYSAVEAGEIVTNSVLGEEVAILVQVAERNGPPTVQGLWS